MTKAQHRALAEISDQIDKELFVKHRKDQPLGPCMLIFSRNSGRALRMGYFKSAGKDGEEASWKGKDGQLLAEIAINPEFLLSSGFEEFIQTLVHEKCHQWQSEYGVTSRNGYHNKQWAVKMLGVGLMPVSLDNGATHNCLECKHQWKGGLALKCPDCQSTAVNPKGTGQKVGDRIVIGGVLEKFIAKIPKRLKLPFMGTRTPRGPKKKTGYVKYVCPGCESCVRGKRDLNIRCDDCHTRYKIEQ